MFSKQLSYQMLKIIDQRKLTLEGVSEAAGLSRKFVGNIVNGKQVPTLESFEKLCTALELEPNDLLLSDKSKTKEKSAPKRVNKVFCSNQNEKHRLIPVCPSCNSLLGTEKQSYCDVCGQRLRWDNYSKSEITFEKPRKL